MTKLPPTTPVGGDAPAPVTVLPVVQPAYQSTVIVVDDADQQFDHSGRPVPPVTAAAQAYRYKVRLPGRNAYACTPDEVLALFIPTYQPVPAPTREVELEQVRLRGLHCLGVIVQHVAEAMLDHHLPPGQEELLRRSADLGDSRDPITTADCPRWDHPTVPLLLMGDLYAAEYGRFEPPAGNVVLLWPGRADRYLGSLTDLGLVVLEENPAFNSTPLVEVWGEE